MAHVLDYTICSRKIDLMVISAYREGRTVRNIMQAFQALLLQPCIKYLRKNINAISQMYIY